MAATEYLLSAEDLDIPALEQETFLPYEKALALAPDSEYGYARAMQPGGHHRYLRSAAHGGRTPFDCPPGLKTAACTAPQ